MNKGTTVEAQWTAPRVLDPYEAEVIQAAMFKAADEMLARFDKIKEQAK